MPDQRALLIAIPLRHLQSGADAGSTAPTVLPAGGVGDLETAPSGTPVFVMATDAGEAEVPAATWRATLVARLPHQPGSPWPEGLPASWVEEHPPGADAPPVVGSDEEEDDEEDDEEVGPQTFLAVAGLEPLPREAWLFTNELVRKQARRGRSFRPRVPTMVDLPD